MSIILTMFTSDRETQKGTKMTQNFTLHIYSATIYPELFSMYGGVISVNEVILKLDSRTSGKNMNSTNDEHMPK